MKEKTILTTTLTNYGFPTAWEEGGFFRDRGRAQIVSDTMGRPLRPIFIVRKGHRLGRPHAYFSLKKGFFIIKIEFSTKTYPRVGIVKGMEINILKFEGKVENVREEEEFDFRGRIKKMKKGDVILEKVLSFEKEGDYKEMLSNFSLPSNLSFLQTAFDEAVAKMHCRDCRQPHFFFPKLFLFPEEERYEKERRVECAFDNARGDFCEHSLFFSKNKGKIKEYFKSLIEKGLWKNK